MSLGFGKTEQSQSSRPLRPYELEGYWNKLDETLGGRLGRFAVDENNIQTADYTPISEDQLRALGGAGASRELAVQRALTRQLEEARANPALSLVQQQRVSQLANQDASAQLDAIAKETEAAMSSLAGEQDWRKYLADAARAQRLTDVPLSQLEALANIFYGGRGQKSSGESSSFNLSGGIGSS